MQPYKLDKRYILDVDDKCFVIRDSAKELKTKHGSAYKIISWHGTITQAIRYWIQLKIKTSDKKLNEAILDTMNDLKKLESVSVRVDFPIEI